MINIRSFPSTMVLAMLLFLPSSAFAESASVTNAKVNETIKIFKDEVKGADVFLSQASGYLVFPRVIKVGIGIGGETGEGALRVGGKTAGFYRTSSASIGFQLGAQANQLLLHS